MELDGHIAESAFLVNESRARNVELSHDRYAHLWVSDATRKLWEDFTREVYPHDDVELPLRNRFFLERLNSGVCSGRVSAFANIGAGFTSYPFLTDETCRCIEVDYAHVLDYKRRNIAQWQEEGLLPARRIEFLAADLQDEQDVEKLSVSLRLWMKGDRSFILLEGITYYLAKPALRRLLEVFAATQTPGSMLAFDFWTPDVARHPVFLRFGKFFAERFDYRRGDYNLFEMGFVSSIPGYEVVETTSVQQLETVYAHTTRLAVYEQILPENYAVLKRVG